MVNDLLERFHGCCKELLITPKKFENIEETVLDAENILILFLKKACQRL
jgi:hypothetical protein